MWLHHHSIPILPSFLSDWPPILFHSCFIGLPPSPTDAIRSLFGSGLTSHSKFPRARRRPSGRMSSHPQSADGRRQHTIVMPSLAETWAPASVAPGQQHELPLPPPPAGPPPPLALVAPWAHAPPTPRGIGPPPPTPVVAPAASPAQRIPDVPQPPTPVLPGAAAVQPRGAPFTKAGASASLAPREHPAGAHPAGASPARSRSRSSRRRPSHGEPASAAGGHAHTDDAGGRADTDDRQQRSRSDSRSQSSFDDRFATEGPIGMLRNADLRPFGGRAWEEWSRADRVYMLRIFAIHAETTSVRLRQVAELTANNHDNIMMEMGWLPTEVAEIGRPTSVEAARLLALSTRWRNAADDLEGPNAPTDEDMRRDDFLSHFRRHE